MNPGLARMVNNFRQYLDTIGSGAVVLDKLNTDPVTIDGRRKYDLVWGTLGRKRFGVSLGTTARKTRQLIASMKPENYVYIALSAGAA